MTDESSPATSRSSLLTSEDWWAIWIGALLIAITAADLLTGVAAVGRWTSNPVEAFDGRIFPLAMLGVGLALITAIAATCMGGSIMRHQAGFLPLFGLALVAYFFANQTGIRAAGVGYAFWALLLGLLISTPSAPRAGSGRHSAVSCTSRPDSCSWAQRSSSIAS